MSPQAATVLHARARLRRVRASKIRALEGGVVLRNRFGDVAGEMGYGIFETANVRPATMPRAPERSAAHRRNACIHFCAKDFVQHILRDLIGVPWPACPDAE